ncbi:hypothetical protein ACIPSA_07705 [Streptomyces sp. NPDC086549]|uniref:hypothetical protein n=1 Tax=Streptomyces sp. NPDC086549 TaxID=3365752 RepID=UPI00382FE388
MTGQGGSRRRAWRWAVVVWAVAVGVGGGLTLWLQDSTEPRGPYSWQENHDSPAPLFGQDVDDSGCPPSATPRSDAPVLIVCAHSAMRR